jgi:hypothetical protein
MVFGISVICYVGPLLETSSVAPLKIYAPHFMLIYWFSGYFCLWTNIFMKNYWCILCISGFLNAKIIVHPWPTPLKICHIILEELTLMSNGIPYAITL